MTSANSFNLERFKEVFCIGRLVWGKLPGYHWWPGYIFSYEKEGRRINKDPDDIVVMDRCGGVTVWVKWFGETQLSLVSEHISIYLYYKVRIVCLSVCPCVHDSHLNG